uniref:DUF4378 domain-containing protein n=1 Tax=Arundo donax TaxID=35708 RepID=A0A0A9F5S0_ARUDO
MKPATGIARPDASVVPLAGSKIYRKLQHDECPFTRKSDSSDSKKIHSHTERARSSAERAVGRTRSPKPSRLSPRPVLRLPVPLRSPTKTSTSMGRLRLRASQANSICSVDKVLTPESKISLSKHVLMGIISYPNSLDVNKSCVHQSNTISTLNHEETPPILCFDKKNIHPLENIPSPVSILDATLYQDGSSPSLRRISNSFKDGETHTLDEYCNPASLPDTPPSKISSEDSQIVPETMKSLIQKLELLKLSSDEAPRPSGSLWTVTANKYQHYIYEILSASALLHRELSSGVMPHQSQLLSYPINPELFVILEQSKPTMERQHRKLIFDLTNELIGQKMHNDYSVSQSVQFRQSKRSSGQHLVKELCIEIERLQSEASVIRSSEDEDEESMLAEDALRGMGEWKSFYSEIQGMVLDIEKFIFKDLIDEVISGEAMGKVHLRQWKIKKQLSLRSI